MSSKLKKKQDQRFSMNFRFCWGFHCTGFHVYSKNSSALYDVNTKSPTRLGLIGRAIGSLWCTVIVDIEEEHTYYFIISSRKTSEKMYSRNVVLGGQKPRDGMDESLVPKEKQKAVDMVTVFVPEAVGENQVYCKSVTSILSKQDYQNYLPVYRSLTEPLTPSTEPARPCYVTFLYIFLGILFCLLLAGVSTCIYLAVTQN